MVKGLDYTEKGIKAYEEKMRINKERWLQKTAKEFGLQLIDNGVLM
jgi:transposase